MTSSFTKSVYRWIGVALIPIGIAVAGFFILLSINPDCDGFACMGYFMLLVPFFFIRCRSFGNCIDNRNSD